MSNEPTSGGGGFVKTAIYSGRRRPGGTTQLEDRPRFRTLTTTDRACPIFQGKYRCNRRSTWTPHGASAERFTLVWLSRARTTPTKRARDSRNSCRSDPQEA